MIQMLSLTINSMHCNYVSITLLIKLNYDKRTSTYTNTVPYIIDFIIYVKRIKLLKIKKKISIMRTK